MSTEFGTMNTNGDGFNLPTKIDDSHSPEQIIEDIEEPDFDFNNHQSQMMYAPPIPPTPQFQFSPSGGNERSLLTDGDNKMYFIILFIAFILGFFMGKTMQPIIIKST